MNDVSKPIDRSEELKKVIEADIPHIYFNGFSVVLGCGDVIILLKKMGHDIATISLSYTVAKTLSEKLGGIIKVLENKTGNTIMTTDDIEKSLSEENSDDTVKQ